MDGPAQTDGSVVKKRRKGATRLSCAECRRLKLRCDRGIPCSSCVKRGCGAICPDGSLTTGLGNRFVLASTQELHEKIAQLATRVRQLEDGLRTSHSQLSSDQHPLLTDDLLKIKAPLQRDVSHQKTPSAPAVKEEESSDTVDASGSLVIGESGKAKFYGQTASSWLFLENELEEDGEPDNRLLNLQNILPHDILARAASLSVSPLNSHNDVTLSTLYLYLPTADVAMSLRTIYYTYAAWMYNPINIEWFDSEIYATFYGQNAGSITEEPLLANRLSLLFMVLAIGSHMNSALPAYNVDAEKYHHLARAALFHFSFLDNPTLTTVQTLYLMTFYMFLADRHGTNSNLRAHTMGIAVKTAQSIGLHMDSGKFKVDSVETQRRRELFWEMYTYDSWQSWTFGRPPSFAAPHYDTKMPFADDKSNENSFNAWKHRFSSECMAALHDQAFGAKTPSYATVLQLDRRLRAFPVPPILQVVGFGSTDVSLQGSYPDTVMLTLQRHIVLAIREMNLLYLHRSFFARAISDHPKDPLGSPYGTSVIAAYRSAGSLVAMMRNLYTQLKEPSERIWFLWGHMFSCAIVLGSIVTRCPSMSLAPSALVQLDSACDLFSKTAHSFRATKVLTIMLHLQRKAHVNLDEFRRGKGTPTSKYHHPAPEISPAGEEDELSMLGGKTRLVSKKETLSPIFTQRSPISHMPVVPLPISPGPLPASVQDYLKSFRPRPIGVPQESNAFSSQQLGQRSTSLSTGSFDLVSPQEQRQPSFSSADMTQSPFYSPQSAFGNDPMSSFLQHRSQPPTIDRGMMPLPPPRQNLEIDTGVRENDVCFPQYLPVYDYSLASTSYVNGGPMFGTEQSVSAMMDTTNQSASTAMSHQQQTHHHQQRRSSDSPDGNMRTTWLDFVDSMGCVGAMGH